MAKTRKGTRAYWGSRRYRILLRELATEREARMFAGIRIGGYKVRKIRRELERERYPEYKKTLARVKDPLEARSILRGKIKARREEKDWDWFKRRYEEFGRRRLY